MFSSSYSRATNSNSRWLFKKRGDPFKNTVYFFPFIFVPLQLQPQLTLPSLRNETNHRMKKKGKGRGSPMCQFNWFTTVVTLPHKSPEAQVYRCENIARQPTILKGASVRLRPGGVFPSCCQTCSCSTTEKCDPVEENGKRIQNNRAGSSSLRLWGGNEKTEQ